MVTRQEQGLISACVERKPEAALLAAYAATTYRVYANRRQDLVFDLRIGQQHDAFQAWLRGRQVAAWAILTACNPASRILPLAVNRQRRQQLGRCLLAAGYRFCPGVNLADDPDWPAERSVLVLQQSVAAACRFASRFGQYAFLSGDCRAVPHLCLTAVVMQSFCPDVFLPEMGQAMGQDTGQDQIGA